MKRNMRNLLIALGAVVILAAALLLLLQSPFADDSSGTASSSEIALIQSSADRIETMKVTNEHGTYTFVRNANKESGFDIEGLESQKTQEGFIQYAVENGAALTAVRNFGAVDNLADYGLESPALTYTVDFTEQASRTVRVGAAVPGQSEMYYAMLDGDENVYSVGVYSTLFGPALDYLDTVLVTASEQETSSSSESEETAEAETEIERVKISGKNWADTVVIRKNADYEQAGTPFYYTPMVMEKPIRAACADEGWDALKTQLSSLAASRAVSVDVSEDSLKKYGLWEPAAKVHYTMDGETYTLLAGDKTETGYYVMLEKGAAIFEAEESSVSEWTNGDFYGKTAKLARRYELDDIVKITVTQGGESTDFTHTLLSGDSSEEREVFAGEKGLTVSNFINYFDVINAVQSEGMPTEPVTGEPALTVTLRYRPALGKQNSTIKFYPVGERRYNVVYNDEDCYVVVKEAYVKKLIEDTEKCASNQEVLPVS